ncbi:MAG: FUSC family protein, partial [Nocardioidaceae bacterium]
MPTSLSAAREALRSRRADPTFWSDVTQLAKTVAASVIAWVVAAHVLHLPQPFLAPWSALLVVHATVYRTFSDGARQVSAAVFGVVLAWAVGNVIGFDTLAVAVALLIGLAVGSAPWFAGQATTIPATALVVLTTGLSTQDGMLLSRLLDTGTGIVVGVIRALDAIDDRIGRLLQDMAAGLRAHRTEDEVVGWLDRTRHLDEDLDRAWSLVRQARESARMNPRRPAAELREPRDWYRLLRRMDQAVAESRSMARTFAQSITDVNEWEPRFRDRYLGLLDEAGAGIGRSDPRAIGAIRDRLDELVRDLSERPLSPHLWPEYGGLVTNLRNIVVAMSEVAEANPLAQPALPR